MLLEKEGTDGETGGGREKGGIYGMRVWIGSEKLRGKCVPLISEPARWLGRTQEWRERY